jgi:hypothetical protein
MRMAIIAFAAAFGLGAAAFSASAAPLAPHPATAEKHGLVLVEGGCGGGWHPVPGHWVAGEWEPTRCAPNDRGGDWSAPYPAYPRYQMYEVYPAPAYPYPAGPYRDWPY